MVDPRTFADKIPSTFGALAITWFVVLLPIFIAWVYANPLLSGPDEAQHIIRAESLVRGQVLGRPIPHPTTSNDPQVLVTVPGTLVNLGIKSYCYWRLAPQAPHCPDPFTGPAHPVVQATWEGRYPPLYYAVVGWPTLFDPNNGGVIGSRVVSAIVSDVFLALALGLTSRRRNPVLLLGTLMTATPVVFYQASVVDPNGFEISAAFAFWVALCDLFLPPRNPGRELAPSDGAGPASDINSAAIAVAAFSGACFTATRGLSPAWLLTVLVLVVLAAGPRRAREVWERRAVKRAAVVVTGVTAIAIVWIVLAKAYYEMHVPVPPRESTSQLLHTAWRGEPVILRDMVAQFGVSDLQVPFVFLLVWVGFITMFFVAAMLRGSAMQRLVLFGLATTPVIVPLAAALVSGHQYGIIWQGRYTIPLSEGLPILSAWVIARRTAPQARNARPAPAARGMAPGHHRTMAHAFVAAIGILAAIQVLCLLWDIRYYTVGFGPVVSALFRTSPLGLPVPVLIAALSAIGTVLFARAIIVARSESLVTRPALDADDALDDNRRSPVPAGSSLGSGIAR